MDKCYIPKIENTENIVSEFTEFLKRNGCFKGFSRQNLQKDKNIRRSENGRCN